MDVVRCVLQFGAMVDVEVIDDSLWDSWMDDIDEAVLRPRSGCSRGLQ